MSPSDILLGLLTATYAVAMLIFYASYRVSRDKRLLSFILISGILLFKSVLVIYLLLSARNLGYAHFLIDAAGLLFALILWKWRS